MRISRFEAKAGLFPSRFDSRKSAFRTPRAKSSIASTSFTRFPPRVKIEVLYVSKRPCEMFSRVRSCLYAFWKKGKRAVQQYIYIYIQYVNSPKKIDLKSASIIGTILRNENKLYIILFHWNFLVSFVETLHIFQAPIQIFNNKKKNPREILPLSFLFFSSRLICIQFAYRIGRGISNVKIVENRFHVYPISY